MIALTAYLRGWQLSLRAPGLIALKWLLNLTVAVLIAAPLWVLLAKDLDQRLLADAFTTGPDYAYFRGFQARYEAVLTVLSRGVWLPLVALFALLNVWLNGGIADSLRREGKATWPQFFQAARAHFTASLTVCLMSGLLLTVVVIAPFVFWNRLLSNLARSLDGNLLFNFLALPLAGLVILLGFWLFAKKPAQGESRTRAITGMALAGLGVIIILAMIAMRGTTEAFLSRTFAGEAVLVPFYWAGCVFILFVLGSWVMRVHQMARLLVCKPAEHDAVNSKGPVAAFAASLSFVSRLHVATFILWLAIFITAMAIFPILRFMQGAFAVDGSYGYLIAVTLTQVAILYRVATGIAGWGGMWSLWQIDRDGKATATAPQNLFKTNKMPAGTDNTATPGEPKPSVPTPGVPTPDPQPTHKPDTDPDHGGIRWTSDAGISRDVADDHQTKTLPSKNEKPPAVDSSDSDVKEASGSIFGGGGSAVDDAKDYKAKSFWDIDQTSLRVEKNQDAKDATHAGPIPDDTDPGALPNSGESEKK